MLGRSLAAESVEEVRIARIRPARAREREKPARISDLPAAAAAAAAATAAAVYNGTSFSS